MGIQDRMMSRQLQNIGWQEWVELPELNVPAIKVKIDTGAKTSSLHAYDIRRVRQNRMDYVSFMIHPLQGKDKPEIPCCEPIIDVRNVMSSNGHIEERFVISTPIILGKRKWDIELTLSNRDPLRFRMLLGREALRDQVIIDPSKSLLVKKYKKKDLQRFYENNQSR